MLNTGTTMTITRAPNAGERAYWNSSTRFNREVKILGVNGENYAVEADGHMFVVPKANITLTPKVVVPMVTTAPKPDGDYWITLTAKDWFLLVKNKNRVFFGNDTCWNVVARELATRTHNGVYTNEWFSLSPKAAEGLLDRYYYDNLKYEEVREDNLPVGAFRVVIVQLWDEKLRRDGIVPK